MYKEIALQVNNNCNLRCPFCFSDKSDASISMDYARKVKDFCVSANIDTIKITGGEPFLHGQISEIINLFSDFNIFIFSNCVIKDCIQNVENIQNIKKLTVLINYNVADFYDATQLADIHNNIKYIKSIGGRVILGRTFYKEPFDLSDIILLCKEYDIDTIRVSQSSPKISYNNEWLEPTGINLFLAEMKRINECILTPNKIKLHFDCPVKPCQVDNELFEYFNKKKILSNKCRARIFIGSDLKIKHCYANEQYFPKKYLYEFNSYDEIFKYIEDRNAKLTSRQNDKCKECKYHGDIPCGCLSLNDKEEMIDVL